MIIFKRFFSISSQCKNSNTNVETHNRKTKRFFKKLKTMKLKISNESKQNKMNINDKSDKTLKKEMNL